MKRKWGAVLAATAVVVASLSACSSDGAGQDSNELTLSAWGASKSVEFTTLVDGFNRSNAGFTIKVKDYDPAEYSTQLTADLAAGTGADLLTIKEQKSLPPLIDGKQLQDLSDVQVSPNLSRVSDYRIDGKVYAIPYRSDSVYLFYNKDLFDRAKMSYPDGNWTWQDYQAAAVKMSGALKEGGSDATATYLHPWANLIQGSANAQVPGADVLSGKFGYFKPYYETALALQDQGAQPSFNTAKATKQDYTATFAKQKTAMMPMGSWLISGLVRDQKSGVADKFAWGVAPLPQYDASTTNRAKAPVTFGGPTAIAVNAKVKGQKLEKAKTFLRYVAEVRTQQQLAERSVSPALIEDATTKAYLGVQGMPNDEVTAYTLGNRDTRPELPIATKASAVQTILDDMHTAIMSGSTPIDKAIADAEARYANEIK
ncbi:sugar ABC transporter substrate-binding protein [Enemella evansiae]|uniref:extracellular solute-binding protein n=1 Tax=Enemella evansiae TaxID=2016499 RepID=UPI000B96C795|nr:extracellular solute-binding protein [Enemella evansiae]OYO10124.1 sugar ABC transporter substrate-binding protein [Enemella evansiae]